MKRGTVAAGIAALALALGAAGYFAFEALESPANPLLGHALTHGNPNLREVALTFDDGPNPPYTERILAVLRAARAPATFFVVGEAAQAHPATIRSIADEGSALGIHGWAHAHMELESGPALLDDVTRTRRAIEHACAGGAAARSKCNALDIVRPPFGRRGFGTIAELRAHGYTTVLWSVPLSEDWTQPGVATIVARSLAGVTNGSIIVLHDGDRGRTCAPGDASCVREQEVEATRLIVAALRARGFELVTIPTMLAHLRSNLSADGSRRRFRRDL